MTPEIILGPPGTGKTTRLLAEVEGALDSGVSPARIGYVAFTKKAATEALTRAQEKFNLSEKELPYFRTLHSLAFRSLGMRRHQMMGKTQIEEFGDIMGLRMTSSMNMDEGMTFGTAPGDLALFTVNLARIRMVELMEQWRENPEDLSWHEIERVGAGLIKFKEVKALKDFTDLLEDFIAVSKTPELDLLVVDESQDLSLMQWHMVEKMSETAERVILAGDDDQAIFQWAGADVQYLQDQTEASDKVEVLGISYRVPRTVQKLARELIGRAETRTVKEWEPREEEGSISYHRNLSTVDMGKGSWLVLARNTYLLEEAEQQCRLEGLFYSKSNKPSITQKSLKAIQNWEVLRKGGTVSFSATRDILSYVRHKGFPPPKEGYFTRADIKSRWGIICQDHIWHEAFERMSLLERTYLVAMLKRGEKLLKSPRIKLSTIHGAKGGQADNVVLYTDMARRTYNNSLKYADDELRVFYVGITRTREQLHIITPQTNYYFTYI